VLFGVIDAGSVPQGIATIPEFAWELSLGIYLTVKGFKASPTTSAETQQRGADDRPLIPAVAAP
jgi:hypothetical protein